MSHTASKMQLAAIILQISFTWLMAQFIPLNSIAMNLLSFSSPILSYPKQFSFPNYWKSESVVLFYFTLKTTSM